MVDKVLINNASAQKRKYGANGYRRVGAAVDELIAADATRGLTTLVVDISDPSQMRKYKAPPVSNPLSESQNKKAIDAIYFALKPHYLLLMDGPDVIPHIRLDNPISGDEDRDVPSDLPYASDERFTRRDVATYAAATRVVGRLPSVTGIDDPAFLISQIKTTAAFKSRRRKDYLSHFAISAYAMRKSTKQSVDKVFRSAQIRISPPTNSRKVRRMLTPLSHFINCHGRSYDPNFYGQKGAQITESMTSDDVVKAAKHHTIVAAETCFGAQLFAPSAARGRLPIANAYLNAGAIAFFGSTNIAYGAADRNGCADLIVQYFFAEILGGTSIGRACLQARQKFVQSQKMESPVNLKTLAQFILLGDPSLQPVRDAETSDIPMEYVDLREARRTRRVALQASGKAAVDCSGFPGRRIAVGRTKLHKLVQMIARQRGFNVAVNPFEAYEIVGGENYARAMKARDAGQRVLLAVHREGRETTKTRGIPRTRILVAHAQNDRLTGVFEYVQR